MQRGRREVGGGADSSRAPRRLLQRYDPARRRERYEGPVVDDGSVETIPCRTCGEDFVFGGEIESGGPSADGRSRGAAAPVALHGRRAPPGGTMTPTMNRLPRRRCVARKRCKAFFCGGCGVPFEPARGNRRHCRRGCGSLALPAHPLGLPDSARRVSRATILPLLRRLDER
jgi:hypothetical protein